MECRPDISGNYIVYEDRNNGSLNADIVLYNISTKKEKLITGDEPQIMPAISEKWISHVNSRQIGATVDVIEYK